MMTAFCCAVHVPIAATGEEHRQEGGAAVAVAHHVGYQDDQYYSVDAQTYEAYEGPLLRALARDGHELQPQKSAIWLPAYDHLDDEKAEQVAGTYSNSEEA